MTFKKELPKRSDLFRSFPKSPPNTIEVLFSKAIKYTLLDEDLMSRMSRKLIPTMAHLIGELSNQSLPSTEGSRKRKSH